MTESDPTGTILVVDDHELVRNLLVDVLEGADFDVASAASGLEAIDWLELHDGAAACVLQDMSMPGISGAETIRRVQSRWPGLKFVVLSVDDEASVRAELGDLSFNAYLEKPCDTDELVSTVRDVLETG